MAELKAVIFLTVLSTVFFTVFGQGKFRQEKSFRVFIQLFFFFSEWQAPYFVDPNTEGVDFDVFVGTSQRIRMLEELPRPIKLAIINYSGKYIQNNKKI